MAKVKVKMNSKGAAALLKEYRVRQMLLDRMARAAGAAAGTSEAARHSLSFTVDPTDAPSRARARLLMDHKASHAIEAKYGTLSRALDAAGGE